MKNLNTFCPDSLINKALQTIATIAAVIALAALVDLAIRSALRLDYHWDTVAYHLPFAAMRAGLKIPYSMSEDFLRLYQGFPFLPEFIQGMLWKITGSIRATGVINYLAFILFLGYCQRVLNARFWLVALVALTAPLVIIHTTVNYIDLFGNCFLAIGLSACLFIYLFPQQLGKKQLLGGLGGLVFAAWSKFLLAPLVALGFLLMAAVCFRALQHPCALRRRPVFWFIFAAIMVSSLPYLKNIIFYKNPFWPIQMPVLSAWFPYAETYNPLKERPIALQNFSRLKLFMYSLFEINQPSHYPNRERWIIDQGKTDLAYRMGGFWAKGVVFYLLTTVLMLLARERKTGIVASLALLGIIGFAGLMPQSNELRYYLFMPLLWAGALGMAFPEFRQKFPRLALVFLLAVIGLFGYMVTENWPHYRIENKAYPEMAAFWGAPQWWAQFQPGKHYCVVDIKVIGMLLTGPTLSEYTITDRKSVFKNNHKLPFDETLCPADSIIVINKALKSEDLYLNESLALYNAGKFQQSLQSAGKALQLKPDDATAYNNICVANIKLQQLDAAINACQIAIKLNPDFKLAKNNLAWAKSLK